jgi:hypothetical protein
MYQEHQNNCFFASLQKNHESSARRCTSSKKPQIHMQTNISVQWRQFFSCITARCRPAKISLLLHGPVFFPFLHTHRITNTVHKTPPRTWSRMRHMPWQQPTSGSLRSKLPVSAVRWQQGVLQTARQGAAASHPLLLLRRPWRRPS